MIGVYKLPFSLSIPLTVIVRRCDYCSAKANRIVNYTLSLSVNTFFVVCSIGITKTKLKIERKNNHGIFNMRIHKTKYIIMTARGNRVWRLLHNYRLSNVHNCT